MIIMLAGLVGFLLGIAASIIVIIVVLAIKYEES